MHMLSKRDFRSEEMETLLRSRNPTVVVTAHGEVQTNEEAQITRRHACSSIAWKTVRRTRILLLFLGCHPVQVPQYWSEVTEQLQETGVIPQEPKTKMKRGMTGDSGDRLRDLPEWLEEFTDNLEDTVMLVPAYSSRDSDSDRPTKVVSKLRKHSIKTHFTKDRICEVCKRTKITRSPCRRRTGKAVLRAEKFGGLITDDHKVLNEVGASRHNHRYSVVVHDSPTQWKQSYPCKTKTSQETERSSRQFLEPSEKPKSH